MLYEFIKEYLHVNNISYCVAKRQDGYGISKNFVQSIIGSIDLLITIDCGIKDYESIKIATDNGIKVIVVDHHEPDESQTNSADAILDPLSYLHRHNILLDGMWSRIQIYSRTPIT